MYRRHSLLTLFVIMLMTSLPSSAIDLQRMASGWHGFNLLNYFNGDYTEPFSEEEFQWMHEWGFNFVRIPISYWSWSRPGDYYVMDEEVLSDIDRCGEWGRKYHIHVCLNLHRAPGYCVNPPAEPEDLFTSESALEGCAYQWGVLAKRYAKVSPRDLSFNLLNEVPDLAPADYERVVRRLVEAIRDANPRRIVMIDGLQWGGQPLLQVADMKRIMQCGRGYQPMLISHYNASWVFHDGMWLTPDQLSWPYEADGVTYDKEWIRQLLTTSWGPMLDAGRQPLFIGEFGAHNCTPTTSPLPGWKTNLTSSANSTSAGPCGTSAAPSASSTAAAPTSNTKTSTAINSTARCSTSSSAICPNSQSLWLVIHSITIVPS